MTESESEDIAKQSLAVQLNSRTRPNSNRNRWKNDYRADRNDSPTSSRIIWAPEHITLRFGGDENLRIVSTPTVTPDSDD